MNPTTHEGFLRHQNFRDLKRASMLCVLALIAYLWHDPLDQPNGGTWLGYTLGTLGALLIVWLTWLGIRKRRYAGATGTQKSWLSAHVYLGLSLITLVTLHTGFQFGWNIHTLAYALMLLVIASGIYGIVAYARYPRLISVNRAQSTQDSWLSEVAELNDQALKLADALGGDVHARVLRSIERMRIGGGAREQLFRRGSYLQTEWDWLRQKISENLKTQAKADQPFNPDHQSTVMFMANQLTAGAKDREDIERMQKLLDILGRRMELVTKLNRDIRMHARMQVWLYLHVPLSVALLAALTAHIVSVFIYW